MTKLNILDHLHFDCPTNEQKEALNAMASFVDEDNTDDFLILCGAAGTGKSSITTALISFMNAKELTYKIAAPTAKAARLLGRKSNVSSNTIHSMIFDTTVNKETGEVVFSPKQNEEDTYQIYIVDESSMISSQVSNEANSLFKCKESVLDTLVSFAKEGNPKNKIIFLGDNYQLAPIHEKHSYALDKDYLVSNYRLQGSIFYLTEVKRQEDGSYILREATNTRNAIKNNATNCTINAFRFNSIYGATTKYVENYMNNPKEYCISINPSHNGNKLFNNLVRNKIFGKDVRKIEIGDWMLVTQKWNRNGVELYTGDHVEVLDVNLDCTEIVAGLRFCPIKLKAKALNGEEQIIEDYILIDCIDFPSGNMEDIHEKRLRGERFRKNKIYSESGFPSSDRYVGALRLTYGHAITCYKAQGGEWDKVFMGTMGMRDLKYQYTAITRAKNTLVLY